MPKPKLKLQKNLRTNDFLNKTLKVQYLCDSKGKVTHAQIPIKNFINFIEDYDDTLTIIENNSKPQEYISLEEFNKQLDESEKKKNRSKKESSKVPQAKSKKSKK